MIRRSTVVVLGLSQLVCWGTSYYLVGALGETMAADLGWSLSVVHGGFSAALVVMGLVSPAVGRAIDRWGGRPVMVAGSGLLALGFVGLALARGLVAHYAAWVVLGAAMRMTLYDAAFASLARIGGPLARRPISHVTLLGGLGSTVFWPITHALAEAFGWRTAVLIHALFAVLTIPLHLAIPPWPPRGAEEAGSAGARPEPASPGRTLPGTRFLYALIVTMTSFLNSGMSAHMIDILSGLGAGASLAVWMSTLRGIGQSGARLGETMFGGRTSPLTLCVGASALLPLCFIVGLFSPRWVAAGFAFALLYGAGNGLHTIVRGTLPLVLFDPAAYGSVVGRLLVPSFFLSGLAPLVLALLVERHGPAAALYLSAAVALMVLAAALALRSVHGRSTSGRADPTRVTGGADG